MATCEHPDGKVRTERLPCGCRRVKCYVCSMSYKFQCNGHGGGRVKENGGRK